jgi:hypothetical protein
MRIDNNVLTRDELFQMVIDAYKGCYSENMSCPWCAGHISPNREEHDQFCLWPLVKEELENK